METKLAGGDQIAAISADDDKIRIGGKSSVSESCIVSSEPGKATKSRDLILGWNVRAKLILRDIEAKKGEAFKYRSGDARRENAVPLPGSPNPMTSLSVINLPPCC